MEHIADGLTINSITTNATNAIATITPYLTLILGILLAFFILSSLVDMIYKAKEKDKHIDLENF